MAKSENLFSKSRQKQAAIAVAVVLMVMLLVRGFISNKPEKKLAEQAPAALSTQASPGAEAVKAKQKADSLMQAEEAKLRGKKEAAERLEAARQEVDARKQQAEEAAKMKAVKEAAASLTTMMNVGDEYGGGKIAWIDASGKHGMIAAKTDLPAPYFRWDAAKKACEDLVENGYSDWYLPSKGELNVLYLSKSAIGGFADGYYWSSTKDSDAYNPWSQIFSNGFQDGGVKYGNGLVRPVRVF